MARSAEFLREISDGHRRASEWLDHLWASQQGRTGIQALNEFYLTVVQKLRPKLSTEVAKSAVRSLLAWRPVPVGAALVERAWALQEAHRLSYWDALIVAAA